jgi:hypothetical protein
MRTADRWVLVKEGRSVRKSPADILEEAQR